MTEPYATPPRPEDYWVLRLDFDSPVDQPIPRPCHISSHSGHVLCGPHEGERVGLVGFREASCATVALTYADWLSGDLQRAVGMYPVFSRLVNNVGDHITPIRSARRVTCSDVFPDTDAVKNVRLQCGHVATVVPDRDDDTRVECVEHGLTIVRNETLAGRTTVLLNEPELSAIYVNAVAQSVNDQRN